MLTAKNAKDWFTDKDSADPIALYVHEANKRSSLKENDIILSTRGTVGSCALVTKEVLPANIDQDVARISLLPDGSILPGYIVAYLNSDFGQDHISRYSTGMVQQGLSLQKVREIPIPILSNIFQQSIDEVVSLALSKKRDAIRFQSQAEQTLLKALGLEGWQPPEPLTYTRRATEALAAGRIDSDFFAPARYAALEKLAETPHRLLRDCCRPIRELFDPQDSKGVVEVRNFDVTDALKPSLDDSKESVPVEELGSTKKRIQNGDVVISRLRSYLRQIAVVRTSDEIPAVGSSEFFVLRPLDGISPDLLMVFLRSAPVQTILKYCQEGNQHPRFGEANLLEIPFPDLLLKHSKDITAHIQSAHAARQEAQDLLERAKRAVEIAIEEGEPAALKFLKN